MRIQNIHAAFYGCASRRSRKKRLIDERAAGVQRQTRHRDAARNLRKFRSHRRRIERQIRPANFRRAIGLESKHGAIGGRAQIHRRCVCRRSGELVRRGSIPRRDRPARSGSKRKIHMIAGSVPLHKWGPCEACNFRLRRRLNRGRIGGQIQLPETGRAAIRSATFPAEPDKDSLCARGGHARRTGIQETGHATYGDSGTYAGIRIDQIYILRAEIGDNELGPIRCERHSPDARIWQWPSRRLEPAAAKQSRNRVKYSDMIGIAHVQQLALLVVLQKSEEAWLHNSLRILKKLEGFRIGGRSGGGGHRDVRFSSGSWRGLHRDSFDGKGISGVESERTYNRGYALHFFHCRAGAADFDSDFGGITAKSVAIDLNGVAAAICSGIGEDLQNLRAIAEGVRRDGQPPAGEVRIHIDWSIGNAGRRSRLNLRGAGHGRGACLLLSKNYMRRGFEILSSQNNRSAAGKRSLRWLQTRSGSHAGHRAWQCARSSGVDETDAAIGNREEQLGLVRFFDFRASALNGRIGNLPYGVQVMAIQDGDDGSGGRGIADVKKTSIA